MSQDNVQLVPYEGGTELAEPVYSPQLSPKPSKPELTPGQKIHTLLRGRYGLAVGLGLLLGISLAVVSFMLITPQYEAQAQIQVSATQADPIRDAGVINPGTFQYQIKAMVLRIASANVLDEAFKEIIDTPEWKSLGRTSDVDTRSEFFDSVVAENPPRSEIILVSYLDKDPKAATIAVNTILEQYKADSLERKKKADRDNVGVLEQQTFSLNARRNTILNDISSISQPYGTDNLTDVYKSEIAKQKELETKARELKNEIAQRKLALESRLKLKDDYKSPLIPSNDKEKGTEGKTNNGKSDEVNVDDLIPGNLEKEDDATAKADKPDDAKPQDNTELDSAPNESITRRNLEEELAIIRSMTPAQIAQNDAKMKLLVDELDSTENLDVQFSATMGKKHKTRIQLRGKIDKIKEQIENYAAEYRRIAEEQTIRRYEFQSQPEDAIEQLEQQLARFTADMTEAVKDARKIGTDMKKIQDRKNELEEIDASLKQINDRLAVLNMKNQIDHRLTFYTAPEPIKPAKDRRVPFAAIGFICGNLIAFGFVMLLGYRDRRMYGVEDAQWTVGKMNVLGVLPVLPDDLSNPEQAAIAAHCVHKIRTLLQIGGKNNDRGVFSVTSPSVGDGKTSLALAMGLSFANSGHRTLLIDCDLAGRGLTHRINTIIRRKVGQILLREGLVTEEQLDQALSTAHSMQIRLGEALVDLGYVSEQALADALTIQEESKVGLLDSLQGEPIEGCVAGTGINNLDILPAGSARAHDLSKLSPTAVRRLLDDARTMYDVVIVDTGPVPESLDAAMMAAEVDGVIMTFSRGSDRRHAERATTYLDSIGANMCGVVFNRAEERDWSTLRDTARTAIPGTSTDMDLSSYVPAVSDQTDRFGPVARAVAGSTNTNNRPPSTPESNDAE